MQGQSQVDQQSPDFGADQFVQRGELVASLDTTEAQLSQAAKQAGGGSMFEWKKKKKK